MRKNAIRDVAVATLAAASLLAPASAMAGYGNYDTRNLSSNERMAGPTRTDLETSISYAGSGKWASAGAHYPGGWDLTYHGYKQVVEFSCKYYGASGDNYGALAKNIEGYTVLTMGSDSYGSHSLCNW